jgi:hypothetical protein
MKNVLSLITFVPGALCLVVFAIVFKPDEITAVPAPGEPEPCMTSVSPGHRCRPHLFAAASVPLFWQRQ